MNPLTLLGASGALLILIAFVLNQKHIWKEDYMIYDLFNFAGSLILVIYAVILESYPFLVLNGVWAGISLRDIFRDLKRNSDRAGRGFYQKWLK